MLVLVGWSSILEEEGRMAVDGSGWAHGGVRFHDVVDRHCGGWIEFAEAEDTRRETRDGNIVHPSRFDRPCSSSLAALIADLA
eukprot:4205425-Pyramimonas_sp.AAC.1